MKKLIALLFVASLVLPLMAGKHVVRISCVGASITEGTGTTNPWSENSYPGRLGKQLGNRYHVENYGRGGCTMLRKGDCPYWNMERYAPSLQSRPDIVFIDLGGNDAKLRNRIHKADFVGDACDLVRSYQNLPTHPRVILMTAIPGFTNDSTEIWDKAIVRDINPLIIKAARELGIEVLDMHPLFVGRGELFRDGIHPNDVGAQMMAVKMADYIKKYPEKPSAGMTIDGHKPSDIMFTSYKGLVMAGYQGWFNAPGDGAGRGWHHYEGRSGFHPGSTNVDLWPEVSEYKKLYKTPFVFDDGTAAYLPSSYDSTTVDTHFAWMAKYGVDGVFMQRFVSEIRNESGMRHFTKVLDNAMISANNYNRAIGVMYDLSGMASDEDSIVIRDIRELSRRYSMMCHEANPAYIYHNGKPLVTLWGAGFNDRRRYGLDEVQRLVRALKDMGFSVMLGVPTYWRTLEDDTKPDPRLHDIIRQCDIVMPWFVGRYDEGEFDAFKPLIKEDMAWCKENGVDYAPLCYPGFSWHNMHYPATGTFSVPRNGGSFFRKQLDNALEAGAEMIYIAMFDEIDEGTAIFKCAERVPVPAPGSEFVPREKGVRPELFMEMVGETARKLRGLHPHLLQTSVKDK